MVWDYFDGIICINLITRNDKYHYMREFEKRMKIPITYYQPKPDPVSGEKGCYESHLNVIRIAYEKGWKNVLIFEDDVLESKYFSKTHISKAIDFMEKNQDWDLFMLGYGINPMGIPTKFTPHILKHKCSSASSYVVHRRGMKKILENPRYTGIPVDIYYQKFNQYLYYPIQFVTTLKNGSDIPKVFGINHLMNNLFPNRVIVMNDLGAKFIYYYCYIMSAILVLLALIFCFSIFRMVYQ